MALTALQRALTSRTPTPGWMPHSDQGVQVACRNYVDRLEAADARISMSAKGCLQENAQAESVFRTLQVEAVYRQDYRTFQEVEASIEHFLEAVDNQKRLHSAPGYRPPTEFEALWRVGQLA